MFAKTKVAASKGRVKFSYLELISFDIAFTVQLLALLFGELKISVLRL